MINSIQLFHFTQGNRNSIVLTSYKHHHVANSSPFIQGSVLSAPLSTCRFGTGVSVKATWLVLCERSFRADTKHGFVLVPLFFFSAVSFNVDLAFSCSPPVLAKMLINHFHHSSLFYAPSLSNASFVHANACFLTQNRFCSLVRDSSF